MDGKASKRRRARIPAEIHYNIFCFPGKVAKMNCNSLLFIFSIEQKAGNLTREFSVMEKVCPRCCKSFNCRNDDILECWCLCEPIDAELRKFLADNFSGCLCAECITDLRKSFLKSQQLIIIENESY